MYLVNFWVFDIQREVLKILNNVIVRLASDDLSISFLLIRFASFEVIETTCKISLNAFENGVENTCINLTPFRVFRQEVIDMESDLFGELRRRVSSPLLPHVRGVCNWQTFAFGHYHLITLRLLSHQGPYT